MKHWFAIPKPFAVNQSVTLNPAAFAVNAGGRVGTDRPNTAAGRRAMRWSYF